MAGDCTRFTASVGVDDEVGTNGSVVFEVVVDGIELYDSGVMTGSTATKSIDVDVTGRSDLLLRISDGGDGINWDHADWANAFITCDSGGGVNEPPTATLSEPLGTTTWRVGDTIQFAGSATDPENGTLPASALDWEVIMHHCPSTCHEHSIQTFEGTASGSFAAPDHEYPSHLEFRLTATDSEGETDTSSVLIFPETVALTFATNPTGLQLAVNGASAATPFPRSVIIGSSNSVTATSPQTLGSTSYNFTSWSDGGAQTHQVVAPPNATTYTATFSTGDGTPPAITAVRARNITQNSARITWSTNELATSQVEYGVSLAYGSLTNLDPALVRKHSVQITNLSPGTTYNYRVSSIDATGNPGQSLNFTFRTRR